MRVLSRTTVVLSILAAVACLGAVASTAGSASTQRGVDHHPLFVAHANNKLQQHPLDHRAPSIDGSTHPYLISDVRALSMFLQMAAHPDPHAGRAYLRDVLRQDGSEQISGEAIETIRVAAVAFQADLQQLRESSGRSQAALDELVTSFMGRIETALGDGGSERLTRVLNSRVKPQTRVFTKP